MTDKEILDSLAGEICAGCGRKKKAMNSHCSKCYYTLSPEMRRSLYQRFNQGYQEAFLATLEVLKEDA